MGSPSKRPWSCPTAAGATSGCFSVLLCNKRCDNRIHLTELFHLINDFKDIKHGAENTAQSRCSINVK